MPWKDKSILGPKIWCLVPLVVVSSAMALLLTGMTVKPISLVQPYVIVAALAALLAFYVTRRPDPIICGMLESLLFLIAISPPVAILDYPLQSLALPLRDAQFARMDAALGFDWLAHLTWLSEHSTISLVLVSAYRSCTLQMAVLIMLLSYTKRFDHLREFVSLFILTCLAVFVASTLWPAEGAYVFHAPGESIRLLHSKIIGTMHVADVQALRAGTLRAIDLAKVEGLVSLPSFHAIFAILLAWCARSFRWLFVPAILWNALVCVSAVAVGGHYLVDVLAGVALAFAAIYAYHAPLAAAFFKWNGALHAHSKAA